MKKILGVVAVIVAFAFIASANTLAPACAASFSATTALTMDGGLASCENGDYEYTFLSFSGYSGGDNNLIITISSPTGNQISFSDIGGSDLASGFTATYEVTLDTGTPPASNDPNYYKIMTAGASLQDDGFSTGVGSLQSVVSIDTGTGTGGTATATGNLGSEVSGAIGGLVATEITVADTFTLTDSGIYAANNIFGQKDTFGPEPSTMLLVGGALVGLGVLGRKRSKKA
jgi:hypothetical protein